MSNPRNTVLAGVVALLGVVAVTSLGLALAPADTANPVASAPPSWSDQDARLKVLSTPPTGIPPVVSILLPL